MFFCNDTTTAEIYALSLHDALPISGDVGEGRLGGVLADHLGLGLAEGHDPAAAALHRVEQPEQQEQEDDERQEADQHRSEEHTSELQSRQYLVCRLLLEKITLSTLL